MKKILLTLVVLFSACLFSKEATVKYSKGIFTIEKHQKIGKIILNGVSSSNSTCKYDIGGLTILFDGEEYRERYSKRLKNIEQNTCDKNKLQVKNIMGGYILNTGNVSIYDKKKKEYVSYLTYEIYELDYRYEKDGSTSTYKYGHVMNGDNLLFDTNFSHSNGRRPKNSPIPLVLDEYMKEAKQNPKKEITYEYDDNKTGRKIYNSHVFMQEIPPTLIFFDE